MIWKVELHPNGMYNIYDDEGWYLMSCQDERQAQLAAAAPQMLEALEAIRDQAECYLQPLRAVGVSRTRWEAVRDRTIAAIAAVKGEGDEENLV